ncbi:hypothetical protein JNW90_19875 [Micromonospora sp. STR1s_5]|nr:hypothetical protein [Micromonospora sp. STR1s_5]
MTDQPEVLCRDCDRPCKSPASRARRIGSGCWRKRRAAARALTARAAASTLPLPGSPTLLDELGQEEATDV